MSYRYPSQNHYFKSLCNRHKSISAQNQKSADDRTVQPGNAELNCLDNRTQRFQGTDEKNSEH